MTSQGKVKLQVWSLIVIVFVLGGVTGGSLDRLYLTKRDITPSSSTNHNSSPGRPRGPGRMLERMKNDLNLNDEQVVRIRAIFDESRKETAVGSTRDLFYAMKQIAESGEGPREQVASIGCSIKWREETHAD